MSWSKVGNWLKGNAGAGASLIGSLLTGNVPGAIAAGVSLVSSATGTNDPTGALQQLTGNPESVIKLKELYYKNEDSIRLHIETMHLAELEDMQKEHATTANVIIEGQRVSEKGFEKYSRPAMAWVSLFATISYAFAGLYKGTETDLLTIGVLSGGYFAWMGLRSIDKRTSKN